MLPKLDAFTRAYIECALWAGTASGSPQEKTWEDSFDGSFNSCGYSETDISPDLLASIMKDCATFQAANAASLEAECNRGREQYSSREQAGHDFWLTRNGHGAGFWDGDWPEPAATLMTDSAHAYGEQSWYVGDDGLIYA